MDLAYGTHLCGFCSSDEGRVKLSASFLSGGSGPGSVCAQPEIAVARLVVGEYQSTAQAQIEYWESQFVVATAAGAQTLRAVGDASSLAARISREELMEYERRYDELLARRFPLVTLCLYDVRRISTLDARALCGVTETDSATR